MVLRREIASQTSAFVVSAQNSRCIKKKNCKVRIFIYLQLWKSVGYGDTQGVKGRERQYMQKYIL